MSAEQKNISSSFSRLSYCWRALSAGCRHTYRHVNLITHHLVGFVLKTLLVLYFLFCALFLTLRYGILPNIDHYKADVEQLASKALGNPVSIGTISASWHGLQPSLRLGDVLIRDKQNQPTLRLQQVAAIVSWRSLMLGKAHLASLEIEKPDLQISRDAQGHLFVAGIWVNNPADQRGEGVNWILSQQQIVIRKGNVRWNDQLRQAPELTLSDVNLELRNGWRSHRFTLQATPPSSFSAPIDVRGKFVHPVFAKNIADVSRWKGTLYADLRDAELMAWKPYIDYPIEINQGSGSVRAWLDVNAAKVSNLTADLRLSNLSTRLRQDLAPLELMQVGGRISASENLGPEWQVALTGKLLKKAESEQSVPGDGKLAFGRNGYSIGLTNFTLKTDAGLTLPPTTLQTSYLPAQGKQPEKFTASASQLDLQNMATFAQSLPLTAAQLQMLTNLAPRGQLQNFSAEWQGAYPAITAYQVQGQFQGLSINAQAKQATPQANSPAAPGIPGVQNLSGSINVTEKGGSLDLASENMTLILPGSLAQPVVPFSVLKMQTKWDVTDVEAQKNILLKIDNIEFVQDGATGSLAGSYAFPLKDGHIAAAGVMDMTGKLDAFDLKKLDAYLPLHTPVPLHDWLVGAIQGGQAHDVTIRLKGDLAHFPFSAGTAAGTTGNTTAANNAANKINGEFTVQGKIENGKLEYEPGHFGQDGKQPLWPVLEKINGSFALDRHHLQIKGDSASTSSVALSNVVVTVPDLFTHDEMLIIEGNAAGAFQNFVQFANNSPVEHWIGGFTNDIEGKGNAKLKLNLEIPLSHGQDTKVRGELQFVNNDVVLQKIIPPILNANGVLNFNEKGFAINTITGNFLGGPAQASGGTQADGQSQIKITGSASVEGLLANLSANKPVNSANNTNTGMQHLLGHASGGTNYTATVNIHDHRQELLVESSMQGLALNFPAPLRKAANESMPLKFEWLTTPSNGAAYQVQNQVQNQALNPTPNPPSIINDEIRLSLGSTIMAHYQRQKLGNAEWQVLRGGIGINVPAPEPESGVALHLQAKSLNVDEWHKLDKQLSDGATNPAANAANDGFSQLITPNVVAVQANELILLDKKLDNVVVGATHQKNSWQVNLDATQASGYIAWNEPDSGRGLGKVTARLSSLHIPESATSDVKDLLESKDTATQIPSLDIIADDFELKDKKLGRLELAADNVRASVGTEWRINKLLITNPDAEFKATGKWTTANDHNLTNLAYTLDVIDGGKLLDRFGFVHVLKGTKGHMDGDVNWKGLPFSFDIPSLSGKVNLEMKKGQFLKVDSGAAKLLGVLSLQSLPRRLALDFRDVFSDGFAFDTVVGSADITDGKLHTDNFKMGSVSATVLMDGGVDIAKETQDLHVVVLPEVNAGAASLAVLAINPVVGISTFLAQLFLREPLRKAFTYEYHITGPWSDPVVQKIESKAAEAVSATKEEFSLGNR
ncbi:YhdP family protein [Glaciimonas soli]|uniref:TIGR02099 family protein n=1 Tax=Glaciimonas soli TaxID=2590999 RepID=A0A843YWD3_9BURK|nr:YhdP family protein [Glaciimonas soli]MQR01601.1 TIGR02099 family protein [Glaciimonas soli]